MTAMSAPLRTGLQELTLLVMFFIAPGAAVAASGLNAQAREETTAALLERIRTLEAAHGAYHAALHPWLVELARVYQRQGDHVAALKEFERALQVSKVNAGVENAGQIAIVESMLDSLAALHDWKGLADKLHYLLWLHRRNFERGDDRLLSLLQRAARWYMQAYYREDGGDALAYMVQADDLFDESGRMLAAQWGEDSALKVPILQGSAMVNYYIARDVEDVFATSHREIRQAMLPNGRGTPYMNEIAVRDYYFNQSFFKGRRALQLIIDFYSAGLPDTLADYAAALVNQGDYYLSLNRKWNAMRNYKQAWKVLLEHNADAGVIADLFASPRRVEPFSVIGQDALLPDGEVHVEAIFDVPENGWPRNIRIISTDPEDEPGLIRKARKVLAATRFRPRFANGEPVASRDIRLHYNFH